MSIINTLFVEERCILSDLSVLSRGKLYCEIGFLCSYFEKVYLSVFSRIFICGLSEMARDFIKLLSSDLEIFASHAKRSTINYSDIKLFSRRNAVILQYVTDQRSSLIQPKKSSKLYD